MRVRVGVRSTISIFLFGYILYLYSDLFLAEKYIYAKKCILWTGLKQIAEYCWYLSMLFGVYAGIIFRQMFFLFGYNFISVFWFVSCPEIYLWKKIYLMNRLETNCRKPLETFHAIWGLCRYHYLGLKMKYKWLIYLMEETVNSNNSFHQKVQGVDSLWVIENHSHALSAFQKWN